MLDQLTDSASALHLALLGGFVCVTVSLMLMTVANRVRLRRVVRAWPTGRVFGLPGVPLLFIAGIGAFMVHGFMTGRGAHVQLLVGYLVGGGCWLVAAYYTHMVVVTEFGLVTRLGRTVEAVAWGQVADYFRVEEAGQHRYVFFYTDAADARRRLALDVPARHAGAFELVVRTKLDARFEFYATQAYGRKAMEGGA